ncbi:MAG: hypothetical protein EA411_01130 [Saprospirales bacterium]|nr:MAG: hypothetical protein EA411_01130 [Saprospirales bacterium]
MTYYTIYLEAKGVDLFSDFIERCSKKHPDELEQLKRWLERIGSEYGAEERYFRNEAFLGGDAKALPPPKGVSPIRKTKYIEDGNNLRLYCMVFNRHNVFLFNGATKTANKAQDCDNVYPHFLLANQLCRLIHTATVKKDIRIKDGQLEIDDDFYLEIK